MGQIQACGHYYRFENSDFPNIQSITDAQLDFADAIDNYRNSYTKEISLQAENSRLLMKQQTAAYFNYRIESMKSFIKDTEEKLQEANIMKDEKAIRNAEGTLRLQTSNLRAIEQRKDEEISRVAKDQNITVRTTLLSINLVKVE